MNNFDFTNESEPRIDWLGQVCKGQNFANNWIVENGFDCCLVKCGHVSGLRWDGVGTFSHYKREKYKLDTQID